MCGEGGEGGGGKQDSIRCAPGAIDKFPMSFHYVSGASSPSKVQY